ncbi:MAG: CaiB/BaiF CoA-transferase family protein [Pseudomonadota bacterium]
MIDGDQLPLRNVTVVEFSHMVMGPSAGMVLADLGAKVIKIEPIGGDKTRTLKGSGAGYFSMYNRNKKSICLNLKSDAGAGIAKQLIDKADVLIENFRSGAMAKLGFDYESLAKDNPRLIYCSNRGFLPGPYEHRTALDEVAQMMGGLAYMTGPPGRPLRAGASVIDVMGGMFGVIGILAALEERNHSGKGKLVTSALYESTVFLMGQHMAQYAVTGSPAAPMPNRVSAWAIYDVFQTADDPVFVGVVSDSQWLTFCRDFEQKELYEDEELRANNNRVANRDRIIPLVQSVFEKFTSDELMEKLETSGLPFAPIAKPEQLFHDKHLSQSGGLLDLELSEGNTTALPALPISLDGERAGVRAGLPGSGQHTKEILQSLGLNDGQIDDLSDQGVVG